MWPGQGFTVEGDAAQCGAHTNEPFVFQIIQGDNEPRPVCCTQATTWKPTDVWGRISPICVLQTTTHNCKRLNLRCSAPCMCLFWGLLFSALGAGYDLMREEVLEWASPIRPAIISSLFSCKFEINLKICSNLKMFKFEIYTNLKLFKFETVQIWKSVQLQKLPKIEICSIWNLFKLNFLFKFENLYKIQNLFNSKPVQIQNCSNLNLFKTWNCSYFKKFKFLKKKIKTENKKC
jgi:hypothetical protein